MEIVLATRNRKKVEEFGRILAGTGIRLRTLDDFPDCPDVAEDSDTFSGNAVKKAVAVATYTGRPAVSDDSGLEVFALGGAPGVISARYAGEPSSDAANIAKLLAEMEMVPEEKRAARFVCCIALAVPGTEVVTFAGFAEGTIGREARGNMGFGYDPVFYPLGHDRTFAEMAPGGKDALSHRSLALDKFREYFNKVYISKT
jgi:XTP/dITP diphosphohydrolase